MTRSGSDVVVIAARRPAAVALQAVLHDWMVQGLVRPCRIVDLDSVVEGQSAVPTAVLGAEGVRTAPLQQDLSHTRVSRVRLAVVGVVDEDATAVAPAQAARVLEAIRETVPNVAIVQLNVSAGSPDAAWAERALAVFGWHNLAISPEESVAPSQGSAALTRSLDDPRWLLLLTGTLCSMTGLWPGQEHAPFDDRQAPSGGLIVPVRGFSRSLSSGSVQDALATRLISVHDRYPTPRIDVSYALTIDDEAANAVTMAEQLLAKHPDVMPRVRHRTPPPAPQRIGAWEAIRQFVSFAGEALANAPKSALDAIGHSMSQATAGAVQNAVFGGADSGFAVVVRGVRADGSSASWGEYEQSLDSVIRRAAQHGELEPVSQKPQLWHDFIDGGMTLLDAGNRSPELPPRTSGSHKAVIATTDRVGIDPVDAFTLPPSLAAFLPNWRIEAGDDIAVGRLFERLDHLAQSQPHLGQAISTERNRLREWANRARGSYSGHLGRRLGDAHRETIAEVESLTGLVEQLSKQPPPPDSMREEQDELASNVRVMTAVAATLIAIVVALTALSVLAWPWLVALLVLIVAGWAGAGAWLHVKSSARVYAYLNRLRAATTELDDATRHRIEALEDLRRISRSYRQYLDWSRAFGAFIHAPLGHGAPSGERHLHVGQGMPMNLAVGVAVPDDEAIEDVANRWRGELFRVGWLSDAWRAFLADLPPSLGNLRHRLQQDPSLLRNDPSIDGVPVLTRWSSALAESAATRQIPEATSRHILDLTRSDAEARDRLLSRVLVRDSTGAPREVSRTEFIEGLDHSEVLGSFQPGMFNRAGSVVDIRQVRDTLVQEDATGLDVALVVMQVGGAYDAGQFAGPHQQPQGPQTLQPSSDTFV